MQKSEIYQDTIETGVVKRQVLCVALHESNLRKHSLRKPDHLLGEIHSGWNGTQMLCRSRHITGTACQIQNRHACCDLCVSKQVRNKLPRQRRPNRIVFVCHALPALMLELHKCVLLVHGAGTVGRFCETPNHEWRLTQTPYSYSRGNSIRSSSSRGTSLFRSMIRAQVFHRRTVSS